MQIWTDIRTSLGAFFRALPAWFRTRYLWVLLTFPATCIIAVYQLADANVLGWHDSKTCKAAMEILHPALLIAGTVIAFSGWVLTRNISLAFLSIMCAFVLSREFGGQGTSFVLYAGLVGLITYGHTRLSNITTFLDSRLASSLIATGYICYAVSQLFDRGAIKRLGWLVTWDTAWKPPYATQIEETLEALGGALLLVAVLATFVLAVRHKLVPAQIDSGIQGGT
jgi:hypothetical protein